MRLAAGLAIGLALLASAAQAAPAPDAATAAYIASIAAMQDGFYYLGVCEKHRTKAELDSAARALGRDEAGLDSVQKRILEESRRAFAAGQAKAATLNWSADQCEDVLHKANERMRAAQAEEERLATAGRAH
jgi:hypothetical protein